MFIYHSPTPFSMCTGNFLLHKITKYIFYPKHKYYNGHKLILQCIKLWFKTQSDVVAKYFQHPLKTINYNISYTSSAVFFICEACTKVNNNTSSVSKAEVLTQNFFFVDFPQDCRWKIFDITFLLT